MEPFLSELTGSGKLPTGVEPEKAASAVLTALAQRITDGELEDVIESLPDDVKSLFGQQARHPGIPPERFDREQFVRRVRGRLGVKTTEAEHVAIAVFRALRKRLPPKEVHDVESQLPSDLRSLWSGGLPS